MNNINLLFRVKVCGVVLTALFVNYYVAYGSDIDYNSFLYNFVKFFVYLVIGYFCRDVQGKNTFTVYILAFSAFFTEHVLFRIAHLALMERLSALGEVFPILFGSFLLFVPVILLLVYIGGAARRIAIKRDKGSASQ